MRSSLHATRLLLLLGALSSCGGDPVVSAQSDFTFEATVDPNPAIVGRNTMVFTVKDKNGNPVAGATLAVDPEMPQHGHGSPEVPVLTEVGNGQYRAFPIALVMVGRWEINVTASQGTLRGKQMIPVDVP